MSTSLQSTLHNTHVRTWLGIEQIYENKLWWYFIPGRSVSFFPTLCLLLEQHPSHLQVLAHWNDFSEQYEAQPGSEKKGKKLMKLFPNYTQGPQVPHPEGSTIFRA